MSCGFPLPSCECPFPYLLPNLKLYRVYSLSSALLIHVYQLHVAMPTTDVVTQNRIRICIACLEEISKVWLVAKMIQNLYEFVISEKGFGDFLKDGPGKIHSNSRLPIDQRSHDSTRQKNDGVVKESQDKPRKRLESQSRALTPALLAHLFAALKSGTSSSSPEDSDSVKDSLDVNNNTRYQQPSYLAGITSAEIYKSHFVFDTQNVPPGSHPFIEEPKSEQPPAQAPFNMHIPQYISQQSPIDHNSGMYTGSQTMNRGSLSVQDLQFPQDRVFMQNTVDRSQYFPSEVGELQHVYQVNEVGYHATGPYYPSINVQPDQPPAPTGPNVLDWSVDFIHT